MKRKIYLLPVYGIGNRLLMIASALRFSRANDLELVIVWTNKVTPFHPDLHFSGMFSTYFDVNITEVSFPIKDRTVFLPASSRKDRFVLEPKSFPNQDIYISTWTHFILQSSDLDLSPEVLSLQLREALNEVLKPSFITSQYLTRNYPSELISNNGTPDNWGNDVLGIHVRKGRHLDPKDRLTHDFTNSNICSQGLAVLKHLGLTKVFLATHSHQDLRELSDLFNRNGVTAYHHKLIDRLPLSQYKNENSSDDVLNGIADLYLLSRTKAVMSSGDSTFAAVSAFCTGNPRYLMQHNNVALELSCNIFSAYGL